MGTLPEKELLRPDEVAEYLRLHRATVYRLCETGKLDSVRIGERSIRIKRYSVIILQKESNE
jgi:excisionase family DNA binding protein